MKGIYKKTSSLVDIVERTEQGFRIQTDYGIMNASSGEVLPVPDNIYAQYAAEIQKNGEYREDIRKKQEEIKQRYYDKKKELERLSSKAWGRKQDLIREMSFKALAES